MEIFLLLFLQFKEIMAVPGKEILEERRNERRTERKKRTRKIRARRKRQKRKAIKGAGDEKEEKESMREKFALPFDSSRKDVLICPLLRKDGPVVFSGKVTRSNGKLNP